MVCSVLVCCYSMIKLGLTQLMQLLSKLWICILRVFNILHVHPACDYHVFGSLTRALHWKKFSMDDEMKEAVERCLHSQSEVFWFFFFFPQEIQAFVMHWETALDIMTVIKSSQLYLYILCSYLICLQSMICMLLMGFSGTDAYYVINFQLYAEALVFLAL